MANRDKIVGVIALESEKIVFFSVYKSINFQHPLIF